ncbi:MAG: threonine/serine exporter family protein, partial [Acetivibrio ethanolgignens]
QRLLEIKNGPVCSTAIQYFAYMVVGLSFTMFFGGKWQDGLIGAGVGAQIYFLLRLLDKIRVNGFFVNIICGFVASVTARLLENTFSIFNSDVITIGTIMLLVPGLAIANSMRDFISSDTMAGMSRLIEALFVATGIAIGVAFAMMVV